MNEYLFAKHTYRRKKTIKEFICSDYFQLPILKCLKCRNSIKNNITKNVIRITYIILLSKLLNKKSWL